VSGESTIQIRPAGVASPLIAVVASFVVPGTGHWYLGRRTKAVALFAPNLALVGGLLVVRGASKSTLVGWAVTPALLWALMGIVVVAMAWRIYAVVDAWREAGGAASGRAGTVTMAALVALTIVPHVAVVAYDVLAIRLLDTVFVADGEGQVATPTTIVDVGPPDEAEVPDPHFDPRESRAGLMFHDGVGDPDAVALRREELTSHHAPAPFLPFDERVDVDRITILLAGGDAGPGRSGLRTDTMIVATLDTTTGKAALFGVPRNYGHVPVPKRFEDAFVNLELRLFPPPPPVEGEEPPPWEPCKCYPGQINALYASTRKWTRTFPDAVDPGMEMLRRTLQELLGLRIDYYALIDMKGFVDLVDAIGGVDVYVDKPLVAEVSPPTEGAQWATIDVDEGWQHLTATEALAFIRARKGSSDYTRMRRQRCLLKAVAAEFDTYTILRSFPAIADAVESSVVTNVPLSFLPDLVTAAAQLDFDDVTTVGLIPPYYAPVRDQAFNAIPDVDRIRSKVRSVLAGRSGQSSSTRGDECFPDQG